MTAKLGSSTAKLRIGYGAPDSVKLGSAAAWEPSGEVVITTTQGSGDVVIGAYGEESSNVADSYYKVTWWDNTTSVVQSWGNDFYEATKAAGGAGAKTIRVRRCNASGQPAAGPLSISVFDPSTILGLTSVDVAECKQLKRLEMADNGNAIASVTLGGMPNLSIVDFKTKAIRIDRDSLPALVTLDLTGLESTSLDASNLPSLENLWLVQCANLTAIDVSNSPLFTVSLTSCNAIKSIDLSNIPTLDSFSFTECDGIESVDISNNGSMGSFNIFDCPAVKSVRAVGTSMDYGYVAGAGGPNPGYYGTQIYQTSMTAAALNQFFADLAPTEDGILIVIGNPGSATCDPTIATAKGYIVVTT